MVKQVAGTSQWRKLVQTKKYSDEYGFIWKVSTWKVVGWLVGILLFLILIYSFFVPDQGGYLTDVVFYSIITVVAILVVWLVCNFIWSARKFFVGFIIALILIFVFYAAMGFALSFIGWSFHIGMTTWVVITALALLGAKRIDGELDKRDVFFGLLVFVVLVGGNAPMFENGLGFFGKVDVFVQKAMEFVSRFVSLGDFLE